MFSLRSNFFDFALLRQGQFLANDGEKSEKIKSKKNLSKDTQRGLFHYRVKFLICALLRANPKPQKQEQKQKMALASLVSFQKQKAHSS